MSKLKPIKKFLNQAKRVEKVDPVVAYYCKCCASYVCSLRSPGSWSLNVLCFVGRLYAVREAIKVPGKSQDDMGLLNSLMTVLEKVRRPSAHLHSFL